MRTWLTERFDLDVPVVSAPMAGVSGGELAAAVSEAGALGMVGIGPTATGEWVREHLDRAAASAGTYGAGLLAWALPDQPDALDAVLAAAARRDNPPALVSVSFGDYASYVPRLREAGLTVATQVGTVADALAAEDAGVDLLVARGGEGGGHGRNLVATLPLLQAVLDRVQLPVLAAGGIATARGLAAALAGGAAGGWVGTAFLTCREALTRDAVAARLAEAAETDTVYGTVFDRASGAGWPEEFGGRAVRNTFFDTWQGREHELADEEVRATFRSGHESGDPDTAAVYAGQGAGLLDDERRAAASVVGELAEAAALLRVAAARVE